MLKCKIMVAGQKGGVGKSAVSRALAEALLKAGHAACVLDYDTGQSTITEWAETRLDNGIEPSVDVSNAMDPPDCPVQILDTPGWTSEHTRMIADVSDIIVLPTGPSTGDDLTPTIRLAFELIDDVGIPEDRILIVLNRIHSNDQAKRARDFLEAAKLSAIDGEFRESTHAASLHDKGRTLLEEPRERERKRAEVCIASLVEHIESLGERDAVDWSATLKAV